jgi:drug/metabolite transporter (DMT)-like permease
LQGLETGKAAILVTVEPLVATLIGFLLWKEQVSFFKVIGILLILVSVLLLSLGKRDSKECSE